MRSDSSKPRRKKSRRRRKDPSPMDSLTDDIVVDILSRLPVKCLCRCKAVSRRWRTLISYEDHHRRKLSQTHPGVFYSSLDSRRFPKEARHFTHVWEGRRRPLVCPSLSFLPEYDCIAILDSCNGMLLCRFSVSSSHDDFRYVVCNPVSMKYIELPDSGCGANKRVARLGFDPALYPLIHVFEFVGDSDNGDVYGANIFSNETGEWSYKECQWDPEVFIFDENTCVFSNGFLHIVSGSCGVLVVDVEGETWFTISLPHDIHLDSYPGFVGIYKERLCYIAEARGTYDMSIWILEDVRKDSWVMKHQVSTELLCDQKELVGYCNVIGILQDCNFILYVAGRKLMAYDMDREEVLAIQKLEQCSYAPYFPYVPFYTG